ncbi:Acetyl-CoA:oxalate CoA-transferase [Ephemeroptericola cinctiostellae]|uniref:Acetyl-CoA:oxalate CoA-transferase n=1 Tax=Ephemeroptericola cinctiostellae TaxID=2268024 RepID=A0A345DBP3_9BURK|nr:CoA transferase [Ephemeroptericola cinctiostellae]AXF85781.1 Acetyl-CoA:oxalate CoA-transferase [Ephemeroptericola cinctiostellae]
MPQALSHLKIIDLSRILAGPFASQTLGDMGAQVIKIEHPDGDDTRRWGPPFVERTDGSRDAAYFFCCNRNKTNISLDFTQATDRATLLDMIKDADVLIENYKVGGLHKYGLDYDSIRLINPHIIYCSITGFGQTGPYKERPGYDALIQAMGGLMSITGEADGAPQKVGVAVVDLMTGMYATTAVLAALSYREQTGIGQHIDLALFDVQAAMLANQASTYLLSGDVPTRKGSAHPSIAPYQPMSVADGYVMMAVGNDRQFTALCDAAGCLDLAQDERFSSNAARVKHRIELEMALAPSLMGKNIKEWITLGEQRGFPCGPINTIDRVFADEQLLSRNMVVTADDGSRLVANPIKFSETPIERYTSPPVLKSS